jgi:hypothetical protein
MTETLTRSTQLRRPTGHAPRRVIEAGLVGALWAVCAGLVAIAVPVLLVWASDGRSATGAGAALTTAAQVWLVAHGAGLALSGGALGLTPLGLLAGPLALLLRAAGHGARECRVTTLRQAGLLAGAIALPYGVLAAVVASLAVTPGARPVAWTALLAGLGVGAVGGLAGALRGARLWPTLLPALPARAARLVVAAAAALAVVIGAGALLAGGSLLDHLGRADDLAAASSPGVVGGVALLVLGLTLVPNAAVWGASWLAGPGFHVGVGTAVGPYGTTLGPVPSLPLLAALPGPVPAWLGLVALCVPLMAGVLAGRLVAGRLVAGGGTPTYAVACREAALVGPCAGAAAALVGWLSGGPVGGGRLTDVGPSPWRLGLVLSLEVAVGAAAAAAVVVRRTG